MKILCPACSQKQPIAIPLGPRDEAAICPNCGRRYKTETFSLEKQQGQREESSFRYTLIGQKRNGIKKPISLLLEKPIVLQSGETYTLVSRSGVNLGLANQSANTWIMLFPTAKKWTFLNKLALFLIWPMTFLALVQTARLPGFIAEQSLITILISLALLLPLLLAPAILWTLKETFQGDERSRVIPGYHPEDEDI